MSHIESALEKLPTVTEFLSGLVESVKDNEAVKHIGEHLPTFLAAAGSTVAVWAAPLNFAAKLFEKATKPHSPEELGYIACTLAFQSAAAEAIRLSGPPRGVPDLGSRAQILRQIRKLDPPQAGLMRAFSLKRPYAHPFYWQASAQLEILLRYFAYADREVRVILTTVRDNFKAQLADLLSDGRTAPKFEPFRHWLELEPEDYLPRTKLLEHAERERRSFVERPVLNVEPFSLRDVYISTECGVLTWGEIAGSAGRTDAPVIKNDPFNEQNGGRHPLLETVIDLLKDRNYRDAIVIQGPPGCGKSAFTQKLCTVLLADGLRPVRVRLRNLEHQGKTIWEDISQAIQRVDDSDPEELNSPLPDLFEGGAVLDDPIAFGEQKISSHVLIFDGWDEISRSGSSRFKSRVQETLERIRKEILTRPLRVAVILTGRPSEAIGEANFLRASTRVLTVRSVRPDQVRAYVSNLKRLLGNPPIVPSTDNKVRQWQLGDEHRFEPVIAKYTEEFTETEGLVRKLDVLSQPLLLHLAIRVMAEWQGQIEDLIATPTSLYRNLIDLTSASGKYVEDPEAPEFSYHRPGTELRPFLRKIALAIQQYGSEVIPQLELERRLNKPRGTLRKDVETASKDYPLSELMISYYFKAGPSHLGCEFLHKSFREYLTAEAIVDIAKQYAMTSRTPEDQRPENWRDFDPADPRFKLSRTFSEALSPQALAGEVLAHIRELIAWQVERGARAEEGALAIDQWEDVRDAVADIWTWWEDEVHLRSQYKDDGISLKPPYATELIELALPRVRDEQFPPISTATVDSNLGRGIFQLGVALHFEIARLAGSLGIWSDIERVRPAQSRTQENGREWIRFAPRITRNVWNRIGQYWPSLADLRGVDASHAYAVFAVFSSADLRLTDFRSADIVGAALFNADLRGANFWAHGYWKAIAEQLEHAIFDESTILNPQVRGEVEKLRRKRRGSPDD